MNSVLLIWAFIKGLIKFSALAVLGLIVVGLIEDFALGGETEWSGILALAYFGYLALAFAYVLRPDLIRRGSKANQAVGKVPMGNEDVDSGLSDVNPREETDTSALETDRSQKEGVSSQNTVEDENFDTVLSTLDREEKFVVMVGLLALYGDGQISEAEIRRLRKIISDIDFSPAQVIHRDPSDKELCLDETLAWALNTIKDDFSGVERLEDDEIEDLFKALTQSIEKDIKNDLPGKKGAQMEYSDKLKKALESIAEADGNITKRESHLLSIFKRNSVFQLDARGIVIIVVIFAFIAYIIYQAFIAIF